MAAFLTLGWSYVSHFSCSISYFTFNLAHVLKDYFKLIIRNTVSNNHYHRYFFLYFVNKISEEIQSFPLHYTKSYFNNAKVFFNTKSPN